MAPNLPNLAAVVGVLRRDALEMAVISGAIVGLFLLGELLRRRFRVPGEYTRKLAHVGGGAIVMCLPWMMRSHLSVAVLSAAFLGVLVVGRVTRVLGSVHDVERVTSGAYLYPVAVYGCFWLAQGEPVRFCVPMAVMAVADAGAALVGRRIGDTRYRVMDGSRSAEGSFTFFALAFGVILAGLAIDGSGGWPGVLLVALVGAVVTTTVEAISVRGVDNLFVPYAAFLVLDRSLRLGLAGMGAWFEGMLLSLTAVVLAWGPGRLRPAGAAAAFLFGTLAYALGGAAWFVPLAASSVVLVAARAPLHEEADLEQVFPAFVGSVLVVLAFAHRGELPLHVPFLASLGANTAIGLLLSRGDPTPPTRTLGMAGAGVIVPALASLVGGVAVPLAGVALSGAVGVGAYLAIRPVRVPGRRLAASVTAGLVAHALGAASA